MPENGDNFTHKMVEVGDEGVIKGSAYDTRMAADTTPTERRSTLDSGAVIDTTPTMRRVVTRPTTSSSEAPKPTSTNQ